MKSIWVNCLVKNEDKYIWYAIKSVIDEVDKVLLWDTGSKDNTLKIIHDLVREYPDKINFKEYLVDKPGEFSVARQKMLDESEGDWIMVLDGDEIWWKDALRKTIRLIREKGDELDIIINEYINPVGDMFHFQQSFMGKYKIGKYKGNITYRFFNRLIKGLNIQQPYGSEGFYDGNGILLQDRNESRQRYIDKCFIHATHLKRSSETDGKVMQRKQKYRYELGINATKDFYYPEVFMYKRPDCVESPWNRRNKYYEILSVLIFIPRLLKNILHG